MDMNKSFGVDKKSSEDGKWFNLEHGGRAQVARMGCPKYKASVQRLQRPNSALLRSTLDTSEVLDNIVVEAMAETILLDWEGITVDGEVVEHSKDNAMMLLREYPDFREAISAISVERKNFMPEDIAGK